ncbi:hypothetical protein IGI04_030255 [Brassica rapa subsp. trilocularis]|uniref:Uncharacterized protein n=1 Tax=Brassica rapa subsp. trilocularis TaxID=1813537 RepID=A0ABQ7LQ56_BRACM|nr:hypothetical protein IGI04_030255 [Brassica rapa subsp. trilocularis]
MATKRLIETMFGYMKDKLAALTAPMANAYANAVVFNKIKNLVATFRHRKSTKTSSRFLPVNKKGNDKSYQNPVNKSRCIRVLPKHVFRKHFGRIKLVLPKKPLKNPYVNRGKRKHNKTITQLGRYVATEHTRCSRPSTHAARSLRSDRAHTLLGRYVATEHSHAARSLRSDRGRTLLGRYVATEHAHAARLLRSDRAHTQLGRYVVTELKPTLHSLRSDLSDCPSLGSLLNPRRNAFRFFSIGVSVEILRRTQRPVRPQKGPSLGSLLNPRRNAFRFVSIGVSVEFLRRTQRPVRPQKGPSLGSLLNPRRNAFRFVSIGVSVEILRRKQVGLASACFHSLRSDLSDCPPLGCLLNPRRNAFRFVSIGVSVEILRRKQRPVSPQRVLPLRSPLNPLRNAFCFVSIGVSVEILRRKQVGRFLACFHSLRSDLSDCQSLRSDLGPPLRSPLNSHRNAFGFVSIGVSVEILRQKQVNLILNSLACFCSPYLHLCVHFRISIETSLVSPRLKLPLRLYDIKKKTAKTYFLAWIQINRIKRQMSVKISITVFTKSNLRKDIFTNSLAVKYRPNLNRTTKYRLSEGNGHVSKSAADKLEYGNQTADKPSSIDTRQPSMHTARSLRSDRARAKLGRYVATEHPSRSRPSDRPARSLRSDRAIVPLGRYVATKLEPKLGRYVATERSFRSVAPDRARAKARSLRSDRAIVLLGRYVATELSQARDRAIVPLGRYVATELSQARSLRSDRARAKARSLRSDRALVSLGRYIATGLEPKFSRCVAIEPFRTSIRHQSLHSRQTFECYLPKTKPRKTRSKRVESEDGPKGPKTRLEAHPTIFLNQKPVNHSMVRAWPTRKDKCQVSADKYGRVLVEEQGRESFLDSEFFALRNFRYLFRPLLSSCDSTRIRVLCC